MQPPIDRLIPAYEAMNLIGVKSTRFYAEVAAGRLAVVRNGRRTYCRASEIARYIDRLDAGGGKAAKVA